MRRLRFVAPLLVAALSLTLGACSAQQAQSPPTAVELTQWETVLAQIDDKGSISTEGALQAFALAFGPLPGVATPAGRDGGDILSGTLALSWAVSHWSNFSAAQQSAALMAVPDLADLLQVSEPAPTSGRATAVKSVATADLQGVINSLFTTYLKKMGLSVPSWTPTVTVGGTSRQRALAEAAAVPSRCKITVLPKALAFDPLSVKFILGHEVFHCVEAIAADDAASALPPWVSEGAANWASLVVNGGPGPGADSIRDWWNDYLSNPTKSMFSRAYDAFPIYFYLERQGVDVWNRLARMSVDSETTFAGLTDGAGVLRNWAPGYFREPALGEEWDTTGISITQGKPTAADGSTEVAGDTSLNFSNKPASVSVGLFTVEADIVMLHTNASSGVVRLADGSTTELSGRSVSYCSRDDLCECPDGLEPNIETDAQLPPGEMRLAVSTGLETGTTTVVGTSFNCSSVAPSAPPTRTCAPGSDQGPVGVWQLEYFDANAPEANLQTHQTIVSGAIIMTIGTDCSIVMDYQNAEVDPGLDTIKINPVYSGTSTALVDFDASAGTYTVVDQFGTVNLSVGGVGKAIPGAGVGMASPEVTASYRIVGTELTVKFQSAFGSGEYRYSRAP